MTLKEYEVLKRDHEKLKAYSDQVSIANQWLDQENKRLHAEKRLAIGIGIGGTLVGIVTLTLSLLVK